MSNELTALEQVLVDTINTVTEGAKKVSGQAIDFASEQVPDVIHQLLMFQMVKAVVFIVLSATVFFIAVHMCVRLINILKEEKQKNTSTYFDESGYYLGVALISIFAAAPALLVFIGNLLKALKIWLAPKIYLIEYVADLIK